MYSNVITAIDKILHSYYISTQALALSTETPVQWLPCPWYHDEDQPGTNQSFVHPSNLCVYCETHGHTPCEYPTPHHSL